MSRTASALMMVDVNVAHAVAQGLTARLQAALQAVAPELLQASHVDHVAPHAGGHVPHVLENDDSELTAPEHGEGQGAEEGHELVAVALAAGEAQVRVHPAAVDGVSTVHLRQDILELDLNMII